MIIMGVIPVRHYDIDGEFKAMLKKHAPRKHRAESVKLFLRKLFNSLF